VIKQVLERVIISRHGNPNESIAVWNGNVVCRPGSPRLIWNNGAVAVNKWSAPIYRAHCSTIADFSVVAAFFDAIFPVPEERAMVVNWLSWNLQNEADKPGWSLFLYSKRKGTGKSTFCSLITKLFGETNSVTQNNVNKLTAQFNTTLLSSKLVVSEEVELKQGSTQSNSLKTLITEKTILAERKGMEAEQVEQRCCFLFTSNHLPTWIEADDRRYYIIEVDHDGHAAGPDAARFSTLVGDVNALMNDPVRLAKLYNALIAHEIPVEFNPRSLSIAHDSTQVMKRLQAASAMIMPEQLEEYLLGRGDFAISETEIASYVREKLHLKTTTVRHLMTELGWLKSKVKWGGVDYARAIWVHPEYTVENGYVYGPNGYVKKLENGSEVIF
jgi:hypothetical protein